MDPIDVPPLHIALPSWGGVGWGGEGGEEERSVLEEKLDLPLALLVLHTPHVLPKFSDAAHLDRELRMCATSQ